LKGGFWGILKSVLGALFGIQSEATRKQDFENGYPWWVYVGVGAALALILVAALIFLAKIIVGSGQ